MGLKVCKDLSAARDDDQKDPTGDLESAKRAESESPAQVDVYDLF
jgi:hypothetical protein